MPSSPKKGAPRETWSEHARKLAEGSFRWTRLGAIFAGLAIVVAIAIAAVTIGTSSTSKPSGAAGSAVKTLPRHLPITLTDPPPGGISSPKPCHITIKGTGSAPSGQAILVSNQEQGTGTRVDHHLYFAQPTVSAEDEWFVYEQLGLDKTAPGTPYTITVWLADDAWVKYVASLAEITRSGQSPWWSSPWAPPGAKKVVRALVTRFGKC